MFRFTIRDLLWLMVVVGCLLGWWLDDAKKFAAYRELYSGGNGPLRSQLDALSKRARSDPALKAEADALTELALRQIRDDAVKRMEVSRKYRELRTKVYALPEPEPSLFDDWPPEPLANRK